MNIQDAKDSIKNAISTYLSKDISGNYIIPRGRQRPIMLLGAPGLGKTAIMSQIAAEMNIGYVQYTITHHTRQSAIGLPTIESAVYGGMEYPITRYTMSEIVASVYDSIKTENFAEGILFIDEINCVSETLAPAMLDLLQNKKFGPHKIPNGWILVAAGNPPEYNSSAREFDIATMDRIRIIDIEQDADVWLRYASSNGIHGAIIYYLQIKPSNLLKVERTVNGPEFVTPRGWEDLSIVLKEYDRLGFKVDISLVSQYIHDSEISSEFMRYFEFYKKYSNDYNVSVIMDTGNGNKESFKEASADEKLAVISIMIDRLNAEAESGMCKRYLHSYIESPNLPDSSEEIRGILSKRLESNITEDERRCVTYALSSFENNGITNGYNFEELIKKSASEYEISKRQFNRHITNSMEYMIECFGEGHETISLLIGLIGCYNVVMFSDTDGPLYEYNRSLFSSGKTKTIMKKLEAL